MLVEDCVVSLCHYNKGTATFSCNPPVIASVGPLEIAAQENKGEGLTEEQNLEFFILLSRNMKMRQWY